LQCGGSSTEVDENTKNIVLECATFEPYNIRKTSMVYGLFTDAVTRFNKGQNNVQNDRVLAKALEMISEEASGEQASEVFDIQKKSVAEEQVVETTASFINTRLGSMLSAKEIASLLENVEFKTEISNDKIKITAPFWRTDIIIAEDIVEEVGRLYGYDRLPVDLPTVKLSIAKPNKVQKQSKNIREFLAAAGANEILTYSFVNETMLVKADQNPKLAFKIANALSPALEYYRLSLMPSLLDKINTNIKSGYDEFALFEIGKGHNKDFYQENNLPDERSSLALVVTASEKKAKDHASEAFFTAKSFLNYLAEKIGQEFSYKPIEDADSTDFDDQTVKPFEKGRSAWIVNSSGKTIGVVGEFRSEVAKSFKLPAYTAGFELDLNGLGNTMYSSAYKEQPKYPKVEQDISLKVNKVVNFATISKLLVSEIERNQPANCLLENRLIDIYEVDDSKTYTFRIKLASYEKTLSSKQVNTLLDTVSQLLNNKIGATRI
jgi:phenylalanyl-tRNA synthetase beta chain